jgi:hypothetical protein
VDNPFLGQLAPAYRKNGTTDGDGSAPALPTGGDGVEQLNMLERIADAQMSTTDKITHLFLAAVARPPSPSEVDMAREVIKSHRGNVAAAVYDIWWALTASNEFVWDN